MSPVLVCSMNYQKHFKGCMCTPMATMLSTGYFMHDKVVDFPKFGYISFLPYI